MAEVGVDLAGHTSKALEHFVGERRDCVVTVCDAANEACPVFPGAAQGRHWSFDDPSRATGDDEARLAVFRRVRDDSRRAGGVARRGRARRRPRPRLSWGGRTMKRLLAFAAVVGAGLIAAQRLFKGRGPARGPGRR
jgi:hypothetical protein